MDYRVIDLTLASEIAIVASGIFLLIGMLTGVWKYLQIRQSEHARAHYYVDIAHRSALLYAPASLILAVLASFSNLSATTLLWCVIANLLFFFASVFSYVLHGFLQDTHNQFQKPHRLGKTGQLPAFLVSGFMWALIIAEVGATTLLVIGTISYFF